MPVNQQVTELFNGPALQSQIHTMLLASQIPNTHKFALIGTTDKYGVQVLASFKSVDEHWRFVASFHHDWATGDNVGGAQVIFSR